MRRTLFLLILLLPLRLIAEPTVAVLEYHPKGSDPIRTERAADQLRDELDRRGREVVLSKQQTADIFFYHRDSLQGGGANLLQQTFREGKRDYYELKFPEAEAAFRRVIRQADEETLTDAHLLLGLTLVATGREGDAEFREAIRLDPTLRLDPRLFPPHVVRHFDLIKKEERPNATVEIESDPPGADIFVNGVFRGVAPARISPFPSGRHTIRLQAGHYRPAVKKLILAPGEITKVRLSLAWEGGRGSGSPVLGFDDRISQESLQGLAAAAGRLLHVKKVLLVSDLREGREEAIETRLVDSDLKGSPPTQRYLGDPSQQSARIVHDLLAQKEIDLVGSREVEGRYAGDILLLSSRHTPFYRKPFFWVVVGTGAATGGILAATLGAGAAAAGSIGIAF